MSEPLKLQFRPVEVLAASETKQGGVVVTTRLEPFDNFRASNLLMSRENGEMLLGDLLAILVQNRRDADRLLKETLQRTAGPLGMRTLKS